MADTTCRFESFDELALNSAGAAALERGDLHTALGAVALSGLLQHAGQIRSDNSYQQAGTALWLLGEHHLAAHLWRHAVSELMRGRITHSDLGGGVHSGLLLWYAWRRTGEESFGNDAEALLLRKWGKRHSFYWPGPIAGYLLGKVDERSLCTTAEESGSLRPRQLTQAHFYIGVEKHASGDRASAVSHFHEADIAARGLSLKEVEFFLAGYELTHTAGAA